MSDQHANGGDDSAQMVTNLLAIVGDQKTLKEEQVAEILCECKGDFSAALDEIWSQIELAKIQQTAETQPTQSQSLQFDEFCAALGMENNDPFLQMLSMLTAEEKQTLLQRDSAFLQQLLLALDGECDGDDPDQEGSDMKNEHPLRQLQALFPNVRMDVIEKAYEQQNCDLNAAADKLFLYEAAIPNTKTFAAIVKSSSSSSGVGTLPPGAAASSEPKGVWSTTDEPPVHVNSLGQFPVLPAKKQSRKAMRKHRGTAFDTGLSGSSHKHTQTQGGQPNVWDTGSPAPSNGIVANGTSTLTMQLKLERLEKMFPKVNSELIRTAFVMNHGILEATEAILQEVFQKTPTIPAAMAPVPPPDPPHQSGKVAAPLSPSTSSHTMSETSDELDMDYHNTSFELDSESHDEAAEWIEVRRGMHRDRIEECRQNLSQQYLRAFRSFRRDNYVIASDKLRDLRGLRHDLRRAQRDAAHDFFLAHRKQLRHRHPIDLHGLIVMQALQVVNECMVFCQQEHIRQCRVICGVGYHSKGGKARLLYAIKRSLERRQIGFREEPNPGLLVIFPLTYKATL